MELKPVGRYILVERDEVSSANEGNIIIPNCAIDNQSFEATVAKVGSVGLIDENGPIEFKVKVGDKVLLSKYEGNEVKLNGDDYMFVTEKDILAIV